MSQGSYVVSKRTDIDEGQFGCGDIIYQLLIMLCALSFVRNFAIYKTERNVLIIFDVVREERKKYKEENSSVFIFIQRVISISCQFSLSDSMQLFIF